MIIFLPILGNPAGRILEHHPANADPSEKATEMLSRYGDICPNSGLVEIVDGNGHESLLAFSKVAPGIWNFRTAPDSQKTLF